VRKPKKNVAGGKERVYRVCTYRDFHGGRIASMWEQDVANPAAMHASQASPTFSVLNIGFPCSFASIMDE